MRTCSPAATTRRLRAVLALALSATAMLPVPAEGQGARSGRVIEAGPPTIAELVEVADLANLSASPNGRYVAFRLEQGSIGRNSYRLDWYVADLLTGSVRRAASGGDPIYGDGGPIEPEMPIWSPDSRFFYHRALVDGAIGIWRTAADGPGSRAALVEDADVEAVSARPDGRGIHYQTGPTRDEIARAERLEYDAGILVDSGVDLAQSLYRGASINGRMASQRLVWRWYARGGLLWRAPRIAKVLDLATHTVRVTGPAPPREVVPLATTILDLRQSAVSATGDVASLSETGSTTRLEVQRGGAGAALRCRGNSCLRDRIVAFGWRPGHDQILFTTQDGHYRQSLHLWSVATGRVRTVARSDGLLSGGRSSRRTCAITRASAVCVAAGPVSPPQLERIDLATGRRSTLFDPNTTLRSRAMPRVEALTWHLPDGRRVTATILHPRAQSRAPRPLFLNYYFCPGYLRGGEGEDFPLAPLASAGFVVACVNMVPFTDPRDGIGRYQDSLAAVAALVHSLEQRGMVDRTKVGMGGFSAGSEATLWAAMNSDLLAAAAVASPQYEPASYWMGAVRGSTIPQTMRHFHGLGSPDETPDRWRLIAPALNVDRIRTPLLMQLPEQEARHAIELFAKLSNTSTPVELYAFPDEGHVKVQPRHRLASNQRNLDWFRYWLQGHVDPDPVKADQYRRWNTLRRQRGDASADK